MGEINPDDKAALAAFRQALIALASNQSYELNGVTVTRANLSQITDTITWLEKRINDQRETGFAFVDFNHQRGTPWGFVGGM